jgi:hypothetical protein
MTGSSARLRNITTLLSTPLSSKLSWKKRASAWEAPKAANTTTNSEDSSPSSLAWRTIWAATRLWGRPPPEKMGSFWPRVREFMPSMAEMPVWMNSRG